MCTPEAVCYSRGVGGGGGGWRRDIRSLGGDPIRARPATDAQREMRDARETRHAHESSRRGNAGVRLRRVQGDATPTDGSPASIRPPSRR